MTENDKTGYTYERSQLGRMLRRQRQAMGITKGEMAKKLDVDIQEIIDLESYEADERIQPILEAYGIAIRANVFTSPKLPLYTVRREPIKKDDLKAWNKIDKLIRRAMTETWLMEEQDGRKRQNDSAK